MSDRKRVETLVFKLLDESPDHPFTAEERAELERLIEGDSENRKHYFLLLDQEAVLRGKREELDLADKTMERIHSRLEERIPDRVMKRIEQPHDAGKRVTKYMMLGSAAAAAVLCIALLGYYFAVFGGEVEPQQVYLYGTEYMNSGLPVCFRAYVEDDRDGTPVARARMHASLENEQDNEVWSLTTHSDENGIASFSPDPPSGLEEGRYTLKLQVDSSCGASSVRKRIICRKRHEVVLGTDKPIYQPGRTVHMKACVRDAATSRPVAGKEMVLAIRDPRGTLLYQKEATTSRFGIAAAEMPLADVVNEGTYVLRCTSEYKALASLSFDVKQYSPPKFRITVDAEKDAYRPGRPFAGTVSARYFFKKPVSGGTVVVNASYGETAKKSCTVAKGVLNEQGKLRFQMPESLEIPASTGMFDAKTLCIKCVVTDTADHVEEVSILFPVASKEGKRAPEPADQQINLITDKDVYRAGETVEFTVSGQGSAGPVFLDLVQHQRTYFMTEVAGAGGKEKGTFRLPRSLRGKITLLAYQLQNDDRLISAKTMIQVLKPSDLHINARFNRPSYRPGQAACLDVQVTDAQGSPVQAALGASIVDEAASSAAENSVETDIMDSEIASVPVLVKTRTVAQKERLRAGEREVFVTRLKELFLALPACILALFIVALLLTMHLKGHNLSVPLPVFKRCIAASEKSLFLFLPAFCFWLWGIYIFLGFVSNGTDVAIFIAVVLFVGLFWFYLYQLARSDNGTREDAETKKIFRFLAGVGGLQFAFLILMNYPLLSASHNYSARWPFVREGYTGDRIRLGLSLFLLGVSSVYLILCLKKVFGRYRSTLLLKIRVAAGVLFRLTTLFLLTFFGTFLLVPVVNRGRVGGYGGGYSEKSVKGFTPALKTVRGSSVYDAGGRAFAHKKPRYIRSYFPETLLWKPELITDAEGRATLHVPPADSITTWRVSLDGITENGLNGAASEEFTVFQEFFVDIDLPPRLTQHDRIAIPVVIYNYLDESQDVRLELVQEDWFRSLEFQEQTFKIPSHDVVSVYFPVEVVKAGRHTMTVKAFGTSTSDAIERSVEVRPNGYKVTQTASGLLKQTQSHVIEIPDAAIDGAMHLSVKLYPGTLGKVAESIDNIFRMPYGCFEQSSSVTYPNLLALLYLQKTGQKSSSLEKKARFYVRKGYQRLLTFQSTSGGFGWFGGSTGDVVLTAYALMQLSDMEKVCTIDAEIVQQTRQWLLSRQGDDGRWISSDKGSSFAATAYIAWALLKSSSGYRSEKLDKAVTYLEAALDGVNDPYPLALSANVFVEAHAPAAGRALDKLIELKKENGSVHWTSPSAGVVFSRGRSLDIETTALAVNAFAEGNYRRDIADRGVVWLVKRMDHRGTWHSTQATVQALRALIATDTIISRGLEEAASVALLVNKQPVGNVTLRHEDNDVLHLLTFSDKIGKGKNTVTLTCPKVTDSAYQVVASYYLPYPEKKGNGDRGGDKQLSITVDCDAVTLSKGERMTCRAFVAYRGPGAGDMALVELELPPKFDVIEDEFTKLKEDGVLEEYTISESTVILYIRRLHAGKPLHFMYQLKAEAPFEGVMPASRVYLYYQPEICGRSSPREIVVK